MHRRLSPIHKFVIYVIYIRTCAKNACVVNGISHTLWGTSLPGPCRGGTALAVLCSSSAGEW